MNDIFAGRLVRLVAPDPEKDPPIVADWTNDAEYQQLLSTRPARPRSAARVKRFTQQMLGDEPEPKPTEYPFAIRVLESGQLIGGLELEFPAWAHRDAWLAIGLGDRAYWGRGYGTDAMRLALRYAFGELNLERVSLNTFGYNERALHVYLKVGFRVEGSLRQALLRSGRRWDLIFMGILREEWNGG